VLDVVGSRAIVSRILRFSTFALCRQKDFAGLSEIRAKLTSDDVLAKDKWLLGRYRTNDG
jgi:hypothetical protein